MVILTITEVVDAKAHLSVCVREAEKDEAILITRHGKAVAALVAARELEELGRLRKAGPQGGLASMAEGWAGSDELVRHIEESRRTDPRRIKSLD